MAKLFGYTEHMKIFEEFFSKEELEKIVQKSNELIKQKEIDYDETTSSDQMQDQDQGEKDSMIIDLDEKFEEISSVSDLTQTSSEQFILPNEIEDAQQLLKFLDNFDDQEIEINYNMPRAELIKQFNILLKNTRKSCFVSYHGLN